jgi:hypothetical protein
MPKPRIASQRLVLPVSKHKTDCLEAGPFFSRLQFESLARLLPLDRCPCHVGLSPRLSSAAKAGHAAQPAATAPGPVEPQKSPRRQNALASPSDPPLRKAVLEILDEQYSKRDARRNRWRPTFGIGVHAESFESRAKPPVCPPPVRPQIRGVVDDRNSVEIDYRTEHPCFFQTAVIPNSGTRPNLPPPVKEESLGG